MSAMPEWLYALESLVWLAAAVLFVCTVVVFFFTRRQIIIHCNVRWEGSSEEGGGLRRPVVLGTLSALGAVCLFGVSRGEAPAIRLTLLFIGAGVTWVAFGWAWNQAEIWISEMASDAAACLAAEREALERMRAAARNTEDLRRLLCDLARAKLGADAAFLIERDASGDFSLAGGGGGRVARQSSLVRSLETSGTPRALPVIDPVDGVAGPSLRDADAEEVASLRELGVTLAVPIRGAEALNGILLLGRRLDLERYTPAQIRLAVRLAALYAECRDWAGMVENQTAQAVLRCEAETASRYAAEIRGSLQAAEKLQGGSLEAGVCMADGWGGPPLFCDTVSLAGGGAALFLAELGLERSPVQTAMRAVQLQSLLRSRARVYAGDGVELVESTHRALLASNPPSPPLALFAGFYDATGGRLRYVNCGFYAPMVLRRSCSGCTVGRLLTGGPPLCSLTGPQWEEGEVRLEPNDLLVMPSQSLTALQNKDGKSLGESKLVEAMLGWENRPCQEMVELVLRAASEYAGTPQPSPMMLLVARPRAQA
jgi:hypothetical protein